MSDTKTILSYAKVIFVHTCKTILGLLKGILGLPKGSLGLPKRRFRICRRGRGQAAFYPHVDLPTCCCHQEKRNGTNGYSLFIML